MIFKILLYVLLLISAPSFARDVIVKYKESPVNVDKFIEYNLKKSSFVKEIFYDEPERYLVVRLKDTFYHYCDINKETVKEWLNAKSLGRHYMKRIKGNFSCRIKL